MTASKLGITLAALIAVIGFSAEGGYKIGQRQFEANTKKVEQAKESMAGIVICTDTDCTGPEE